jgi:hypothetical protein
MNNRGMIVSVQFQAGEFRGDWNTELRDKESSDG